MLIVGGGLYGATMANLLTAAGVSCLVLEKREHIAGNVYTAERDGVCVHQYGAHIFHTKNAAVWEYVQRFTAFNRYTNCPIANYKGELYNLPFNMNTFHALWGVITPQEARRKLDAQRAPYQTPNPRNLQEQALCLVGPDIYEKLIRGYTEKQWGRPCGELPAFIIKRLPLRFTYDNNYYDDPFQGIPVQGYTAMVERMLDGVDVLLGTNYLDDRERWDRLVRHVIYSGPIDAYFGHSLGALAYRSLRFETETLPVDNYQGNAVVNYTDAETPYTRVIEHKHFQFGTGPHTVVTREYSETWTPDAEPYYPINDERNNALYRQYRALADGLPGVTFGGRLGEYRYYDMDTVIERAMTQCGEIMKRWNG